MEQERDALKSLTGKKDEELEFSKLLADVIGGRALWLSPQEKTNADRNTIPSSCMMMEVSNQVSANKEIGLAVQRPSISDRQREISIIMLHWLYENGDGRIGQKIGSRIIRKEVRRFKIYLDGYQYGEIICRMGKTQFSITIPKQGERIIFFCSLMIAKEYLICTWI